MRIVLAALAAAAMLAVGQVRAGVLAPAPQIIAEYDRSFIERSGAQTFHEMLDTGIIRYFFTGGRNLLILVNGRPYATTASQSGHPPALGGRAHRGAESREPGDARRPRRRTRRNQHRVEEGSGRLRRAHHRPDADPRRRRSAAGQRRMGRRDRRRWTLDRRRRHPRPQGDRRQYPRAQPLGVGRRAGASPRRGT